MMQDDFAGRVLAPFVSECTNNLRGLSERIGGCQGVAKAAGDRMGQFLAEAGRRIEGSAAEFLQQPVRWFDLPRGSGKEKCLPRSFRLTDWMDFGIIPDCLAAPLVDDKPSKLFRPKRRIQLSKTGD